MIGTLLAEAHLRHERPEAARAVLGQVRSLTQSMPTYFYAPKIFRVEAELLRLDGREDKSRRLLLRAISTARDHGSWALAVRSALALSRLPSATRQADLSLLADLFERIPPENDTYYERDARALLGESDATTAPWEIDELLPVKARLLAGMYVQGLPPKGTCKTGTGRRGRAGEALELSAVSVYDSSKEAYGPTPCDERFAFWFWRWR